MRTAIIYRSNDNLDSLLANLKNKVELFYVFPSFECGQSIGRKAKILFESGEWKNDIDLVICDATCYSELRYNFTNAKFRIIKQAKEGHVEYMQSIANEAKSLNEKVYIVSNKLAHHVTLDGICCYNDIHGRDTWLHKKVLDAWQEVFDKNSVIYEVVDDDFDFSQVTSEIIVIDHHNLNWPKLRKLHRQCLISVRPAYQALDKNSYKEVSEILTELKS